jgi:hypothetical protein
MQISLAKSSALAIRLTGKRLFIARLVWVFVLLLAVGKTTLGLPLFYAEKNTVCIASEQVCSQGNSLNARQVQALESSGITLTDYARVSVALQVSTSFIWAGIGLSIFLLRPKEALALIASAMMVLFMSAGYDTQISIAYPSLDIPSELVFNLGNILMFLFIGLFPSGRFSPHWMRWYWFGIMVLSILPSTTAFVNSNLGNVFYAIFWLSFLVLGPFSQIYRYRKESNASERQQTKLVVWGFTGFAGIVIVWAVFSSMLPEIGLVRIWLDKFVFDFGALLIPLSIGLSVLRYRLWDIDVFIRRTLQYTILTGLLAMIYFGSVVLAQRVAIVWTGSGDSPLIVVVSTLLVAALFNPLRRRVQAFIDRRFFRQKYDAIQTLAAFTQVARDETRLDALVPALLQVVKESMQPEQAWLWLKKE